VFEAAVSMERDGGALRLPSSVVGVTHAAVKANSPCDFHQLHVERVQGLRFCFVLVHEQVDRST